MSLFIDCQLLLIIRQNVPFGTGVLPTDYQSLLFVPDLNQQTGYLNVLFHPWANPGLTGTGLSISHSLRNHMRESLKVSLSLFSVP